MPYPNIHAAQILAPSEYDKIVGQKEVAPGVNVLFAKIKGEDGTKTASYHFDKAKFTAEEAKEWLKKNGVKDYKFEAAREENSACMAGYERRLVTPELSSVSLASSDSNPRKRMIVGYAARFYDGSPQTQCTLQTARDGSARVVERIMPSAFDSDVLQNLGGQDVIATFNHNPDMLLGRRSAGTLRLSCDHAGLRYEIDPPDTQAARDLTSLMERGDVGGSSFGFKCRRDRWSKDGDCTIRMLEDVRIEDVGPVSQPAYAGASAGLRAAGEDGAREAIRSMEEWQRQEARAAIDAMRARTRLAEIQLRRIGT
jgi:HK97 family phage prohead protease